MKRVLLAAAAALSLAACATAPTHYQPARGPSAVGYSELRIEPGRYRILFQGGPGAPAAQVQDYALLRAADLALADGYDWFRVVDRGVSQTGYGGSSVSFGIGGASFGSHSATAVGVDTGFPLSGGAALAASLEVLMGRGPKPPDGNVYDARSVRASIGGHAA
jgi:opacity protein-like surface antigen